MSLILAGIAVASSLLQSSQTDDAWKATAASNGQNSARLQHSTSRALSFIPGQATAVGEAAMAANISAQKNEAEAIANATVNAAASGSAGANVEQVKQGLEGSGANVRAQIDKQRKAQMLQIRQDAEDIIWKGVLGEKETVVKGGGSAFKNVLSAGLSGASAFISTRGVKT